MRIQEALVITTLAIALTTRGALADPLTPAPKHVTLSGELVGLAGYISYGRVGPPKRPPAAPMMPPPRMTPPATPTPGGGAGMSMSGSMQGGTEQAHEMHEMREMHEDGMMSQMGMGAECASMGLVTSSGAVYIVAPEQMHAHMMLCMSLGRTVKLEGSLYTRAGLSLIIPQAIETGL